MSKIKNKKRLASVVLAFLLVFVVGAAFALQSAQLTIGGTVNLDPDEVDVTWIGVGDGYGVAARNTPGTITVGNGRLTPLDDAITAHTAVIDNGNTNITWTVTFAAPGTAEMTIQATNWSSVDVIVYEVDVDYAFSDDVPAILRTLAAWGIEYSADDFVGTQIAAPTAPAVRVNSAEGYVSVEWDGTIPDTLPDDFDFDDFYVTFDITFEVTVD